MAEVPMTWKKGGCHCGAVTYEVLAPDEIEVRDCNCSICSKSGHLHYHVGADRFRLLTGKDKLTTYTFNTGVAQHYFCSICGIKSFYVPRSMPEGYSVNVRCLEPGSVRTTHIVPFDGEHWEEAVDELRAQIGAS